MDGLQIEEHNQETGHHTLQKHLHQRLGKSSDNGLKTPMRPGLGLVVNDSKTPGTKSLQGFSSTRKMHASEPKKIDFEIFEDDEEEDKIESPPESSPIDTCGRIDERDVPEYIEIPYEYDDILEDDVEVEDDVDYDYDPIEPATKIGVDDYCLPMHLDEFLHYNDVILEEVDYWRPEYEHIERSHRQWEELDMDELLAELEEIVAEQGY